MAASVLSLFSLETLIDYFDIFLMTLRLNLFLTLGAAANQKLPRAAFRRANFGSPCKPLVFFLFPFHATNPGLSEPGPPLRFWNISYLLQIKDLRR